MIKAGIVSMTELKTAYTLDEMLKLYALYMMDVDVKNGSMEEATKNNRH